MAKTKQTAPTNDRMVVVDLYLSRKGPNGKEVITHHWTSNAVRFLLSQQEAEADLMNEGKDFDIVSYATVEEYRAYKGYKGS